MFVVLQHCFVFFLTGGASHFDVSVVFCCPPHCPVSGHVISQVNVLISQRFTFHILSQVVFSTKSVTAGKSSRFETQRNLIKVINLALNISPPTTTIMSRQCLTSVFALVAIVHRFLHFNFSTFSPHVYPRASVFSESTR